MKNERFKWYGFLIGLFNVLLVMLLIGSFTDIINSATTELSVLKIIALAVLFAPIMFLCLHNGVGCMANQIVKLRCKKC